MTSEKDTSKAGEEKLTEFESTRGVRYVEIFTVGPEWMTVYNTTDVDEAPPEVWDAFDAEAAAKEMGVGMVLKNGPHWWAFDEATLRFGVDVVTVGNINFRTAAKLPAFLAKSGNLEPPFYTVVEANKEGELRYLAGEPVYELVSPDGEVFVMQGSSIPPSEYATLGEDLTLAEGWQFRTRTLEEDLTVPLDGKVKVVMDNFKDVYNMPRKPGASAEEDSGEAKDLDVMIAIYPGPEQAQKDFDEFLALVEDKTIKTEGIVLVTRDDDGEVQVQETGDHAGRKGAKIGGGLGLVVGLFAPPLLAATAVGAVAGALLGKFAKGRVTHGIAEAMDEKLPPGAAGIIAIYDHEHAGEVDGALANAFTKSIAGIDKASAKELKAGLDEAQAGL